MNTKITITLIFIFFGLFAKAQQLDRILGQQLTQSMTWKDSTERLFTYNTGGQLTLEELNIYTLPGATWDAQLKTSYYYSTLGMLDSSVEKLYNYMTGTPYTGRTTYRYTYTGTQLTEQYTDMYDYNTGNFSSTQKDTFIYDGSGFLIEKQGSLKRFLYTNNTMGQPIEIIEQKRSNPSITTWTDLNKTTITYAAGQPVTKEHFFKGSTTWEAVYNEGYSYSTAGIDTSWYIITYGGANDTTRRFIYFYSTPATGLSHVANQQLTVYPNPAAGQVFVTAGNQLAPGTVICITNMAGQQVYTQTLTNSAATAVMDIQTLPAGIYIVHVQSGSTCTYKKITVSR